MHKILFITNGRLDLTLENASFGKHYKDPSDNVKSFFSTKNEIQLVSDDIGRFTSWGLIELIPDAGKLPIINACVTGDNWGWFATAHLVLEKDGQIIFNDNFQSGLIGPVGNPTTHKSYPVQT